MTETEKQLNINAKFWQGKFQTARKQRNLLNQKISNLLIAIEEGWERKEGGVSSFGISDELANRYVGR